MVFNVSYEFCSFLDWERPKPNSSTGPPMTRKSSSASSPRESGTPRNQNNREMTTVSVCPNQNDFNIKHRIMPNVQYIDI